MITRDLRRACGFTEPGMRSRFDAFVTRLQMATYVVTEDFVYPRDRRGREYGWGWALLTTPETLYGQEACRKDCPPEVSLERMTAHMQQVLPHASEKAIRRMLSANRKGWLPEK